jgi:hypothetical protein
MGEKLEVYNYTLPHRGMTTMIAAFLISEFPIETLTVTVHAVVVGKRIYISYM